MWDGGASGVDRTKYRNGILKLIRENVDSCQSKFGGCTLLATESEPSVTKIIQGIELILQDGLKPRGPVNLKNINLNVNHFSLRQVTELVSNGISMVMGPTNAQEAPVFWLFVRNHLTRHEQDRYYHLQHVATDYGRGRSWLRSSINEHSLDRYLRMLFSDESLISGYYESSALINHASCRECLLDSARKLRTVIFALVVDRRELDHVDEQKQQLIKSLQPEPEAVLPRKTSPRAEHEASKSQPLVQSKKTKLRFVDLDGEPSGSDRGRVEEAAEAFDTVSISIPENGRQPSLILPIQAAGNSPSNQSFDSAHEIVSPIDCQHGTLSSSEMRRMLLDMMDKKQSLEEQKSEVQVKLNDTLSENQQLRDRLTSSEQLNGELSKENTILKEQLKKYMSALQLLKTETPNKPVNGPSPSSPPLDYHREASHFEEKLVQVAEMHGELMEFNSYLQRQLQSMEILVNRMREELVQLRGPLPLDFSVERLITNSQEGANDSQAHPLIHVWIPSTFLVHGTADPHHIYQVYLRIADEEWTIYKRYSQLYKFRKEAQKSHPFVSGLNFPPKKNFGRQRDEKIVEERRRKLQEFLRQFLNLWIREQTAPLTKASLVQLLPFFGK